MAAENQLCAMCLSKTPKLCCSCTGSRVKLCGACVGPHVEEYSQLRHAAIPIAISATSYVTYLQEVESFVAGKAELEQIPSKIDQRCDELAEAVNFVVANLHSYRDECVRQLQELKVRLTTEIAEAVGEVQAALSGGKVELRGKYSHLLIHFKPGDFDSVAFLVDGESVHSRELKGSWELMRQHITQFRPQEVNRAREEARKVVPTDPPTIVYADCNAGVHEFTHVEDGIPVMRQLYQFGNNWDSDKPFIDWGSSYTLLDAERLITCGFASFPPWTPSYVVFLCGTKKFARLHNMNDGRVFPGILKHAGYIFVFGSTSTPCCNISSYTSGEYYSISNGGPWTLASGVMSAQRCCFTPCAMDNFIYLCGGLKSNTIDLFDIKKKAFARCAGVLMPEVSGCIAFMRGNAELVVISNTKVSFFPIFNGVLKQGKSKDHRQLDIKSKSTPVLFPGNGLSVYFINSVDREGKCVRFILEADNSVRAIDEVSA